jgi:hypothetical protein
MRITKKRPEVIGRILRRMLVKKNALSCARVFTRISKSVPNLLRRGLALIATLALTLAPAAPGLYAAPAPAKARPVLADDEGDQDGCNLNSAHGDIKHVIYIQFDNVHFRRDNPNVPSDLEQMPHLLNFLTGNGTLLSNHYTPLKSHTADDIVTSLTGVYGDRHGQPIANSFDYFIPGSSYYTSSFQYWTDIVDTTYDPTYYMVTADGKNAPAPWVPWTRAGCNVGAVSTANIELENVSGDLSTVFASDPTVLNAALAEENTNYDGVVADFEGIAIHCAKGSEVCSSKNHGEPDVLPQEPGGYTGFKALFGHKFVAPVINPGGPLYDLNGNLITDSDSPANVGFPGFGGISAAQSLAYVAAMQEHGVPVTYAYISDAHDNHVYDNPYVPAACQFPTTSNPNTDPELAFGTAMGPGELCYEKQLASYDEAFGKFFARLESDGITKKNTLFVITADEGDHFAGGLPVNPSCDGVNIPCSYINTTTNTTNIGELDADMAGLLATQQNVTNGFDIQFDMVPVFYVYGQPGVGSTLARSFEVASSKLTAVNPRTGKVDKLSVAAADPAEMKLLHLITGDPDRTPTFVMFGDPDYYFQLTGDTTCSTPCVYQGPGYAWNHGGIQPEIVNTWLGIVGPGVKNNGVDGSVWSDHTDIRPTMLVLAGLQDDYQHEGRALIEDIEPWALPGSLTGNSGAQFVELAEAFKQINAPNAKLGHITLGISTKALAGDNSTYTNLENKITGITSVRDLLAGQMLDRLEDAEFNNAKVSPSDTQTLVNQSHQLLNYVEELGDN